MLKSILLLAVSVGAAPFCVVTGFNTNCFYYDANQCKKEASRVGGMCVMESETTQQKPAPILPTAPTTNAWQITGEALQKSSEITRQLHQDLQASEKRETVDTEKPVPTKAASECLTEIEKEAIFREGFNRGYGWAMEKVEGKKER